MGTTVAEARTPELIREDIAYYNHRAKRYPCWHEDWPLAHAILNELLGELGY